MKELGEALKVIFEKIAGFFDIFDLSFFVSGALTLSAVLFSLYSAGVALPIFEGWKEVLGIVLGCYIGGLLSFAAGRWLRMSVVKRGESRSFHIS
jgi:membrane protein DedA with SNARE-associated domain